MLSCSRHLSCHHSLDLHASAVPSFQKSFKNRIKPCCMLHHCLRANLVHQIYQHVFIMHLRALKIQTKTWMLKTSSSRKLGNKTSDQIPVPTPVFVPQCSHEVPNSSHQVNTTLKEMSHHRPWQESLVIGSDQFVCLPAVPKWGHTALECPWMCLCCSGAGNCSENTADHEDWGICITQTKQQENNKGFLTSPQKRWMKWES